MSTAAYRSRPENKEHIRLKNAKRYSENKEWFRKYSAAYRAKPENKKDAANLQRKRLYDITPERFEEMLASQGSACAICFRRVSLVVDHNHKTGEVRGLLCRRCNISLGGFQDSPILLENAKTYLTVLAK